MPKEYGRTPMHVAAIIKILAPLTDNPNPKDENCLTPITIAAMEDNWKIVQILAHVAKNPFKKGYSGPESALEIAIWEKKRCRFG